MKRRTAASVLARSAHHSTAIALPGLLAAVLLTCGRDGTAPVGEGAVDRAAAVITPSLVERDVGVLAADSLLGRRTPSPGLTAASLYIEAAFQSAGLSVGGDQGYRQTYPCAGATALPTNVIAALHGSDPRLADSWVTVTAHYDHVGIGMPDERGDSIYNGADDNASGTAALLAVARAFAALPTKPARSIAFVAVSGEELGFVGAWQFLEHRPRAIGTIVANINLDMVGRNAPDLLYGMGESLSSLGTAFRRQVARHPELGLRPEAEIQLPPSYQASDQIAFAGSGIPAIFLHTGSHVDLHRPSDELSRLDTDKAARVARLAFYMAYDIASDSVQPSWTPAGDRALPTLRLLHGTCGK